MPRLSREAIQAILDRDKPGFVLAFPEDHPTQAELDALAQGAAPDAPGAPSVDPDPPPAPPA